VELPTADRARARDGITKPQDSRHFYAEVDGWLARDLKDGASSPAVNAGK
jgi:hypothetical protein